MNEEVIKDLAEDTQDLIEPTVEGDERHSEVADLSIDESVEEEAPDLETVQSQLTEAREQAAEYLDGWQRARAEFANARKRLEKERVEAYRIAAVDYASKILPIFDDFDRAIENVPEDIEADNWFAGIALVRRKLSAILDGLQVEPIVALGEPFDPAVHEALALMDADGVESGIVIEELQTGYRLGERVIRPSLVNVSG